MTTKTSAEEIVRNNAAEWDAHDLDAIVAAYVPGATVVDPAYDAPLSTPEAIRKDASDFFTAFPDLRFQITNLVSNGNSVCIEGVGRGTHTGPLALPSGLIPATSKRVEFRIAIFDELDASGHIRQEHRYYDLAGMLVQLGLMQ